jgi:cytochrome c-type biogenesis protein CcmH
VSRAALGLVVLALAALMLCAGAPAAPRTTLNDVEDEVMCVSCGVPLNIAESPQASAERNEIQKLVDRGLTKRQIKDRLVAQYGREVLAEPDHSGFGAAAYIVPIVLALLALGGLAVMVPRWRANDRTGETTPAGGEPAAATTTAPALSDADARRLDEDLARYDV